MAIGVIAQRAKIATSAIRYYERRGLVAATTRTSGQRRYNLAALRRVIFIGMLQDAGLTLDDIAVVLSAGNVEDWKEVARNRLAMLREEIARLQTMSELLDGALLCRYDHPLNECRVMGDEINRRLAQSQR